MKKIICRFTVFLCNVCFTRCKPVNTLWKDMGNKIDEMIAKYGLKEAASIWSVLQDFGSEQQIRDYCWEVLRSYTDLKKEDWFISMEGGDYIYSFSGHYIFITDDIWSFNLIAQRPVLDLLVEKIKILESDH